MLLLSRSTIRVMASTLLVVFLSALLGPLAAWARLASTRDHLHLPGMPQAHHHHLEDHTRADACARQPVKRSAAAQHAHAGSGEQQLTSVAPLLQKLVGSVAVVPTAYLGVVMPVRPLAWPRSATVALVPPGHLPPKIPDLRIFLGSLLI
ncbi:hypothetical protein [Hymenobacter cellulosivorans]|uniref:DUF2946 domain-containing protein n=1 Tax=Hymenobacter cellulosivorans TaxID=2932249 RepID=A0ABY4F7T1_9BACT|nr:hypothetical protein [Hymenobacter cellulosivorans]UOQ52261.1 hypothetical protein MUN80_21170 [Hymenobacter cellulosivorans]